MGDDSDDDEFNASLPPQVIEKEREKVARRSLGAARTVSVVKRGVYKKPTKDENTETFDFPDDDNEYEDIDAMPTSSESPLIATKASSVNTSQERVADGSLPSPAASKSPIGSRKGTPRGTPKGAPSNSPKPTPKRSRTPPKRDKSKKIGASTKEEQIGPADLSTQTSSVSITANVNISSDEIDNSATSLTAHLLSRRAATTKETLGFSPPTRVKHVAESKNGSDKYTKQAKKGGRLDEEDEVLMSSIKNGLVELSNTSSVAASPISQRSSILTWYCWNFIPPSSTSTVLESMALFGQF